MAIDLEQFHQVFYEESFEGLDMMESSLMELDPAEVDGETINAIFRCAHSIKGGSATFGFTSVSEFTHVLETSPHKNIFESGNDPFRNIIALNQLGATQACCDFSKLPDFSDFNPEHCYLSWEISLQSSVPKAEIEDVFEWIEDECDLTIEQKAVSASENTDAASSKLWQIEFIPSPDLLRTGNEPSRLFRTLAELGDVIHIEATVDEAKEDAKQKTAVAAKAPVSAKKESKKPVKKKNGTETTSIRVGIDKVDSLINMVGELVITQSMLGQLGEDFDIDSMPKLIEGLGQLEQNTRELQESVMKIRMLPISFAFSRFPRMVRDLGQTLKKSVDLEMKGENTELDKTVMEKIGDPLVHLVRNAVDHGIETPEERTKNGKDPSGKIVLNAYHQSGNVVIEIIDDGKGLDRDGIVEKAVERELISEKDTALMTDEQVFDLIFQPGFSTAKTVSDVSGRGVGMDVVKRRSLNRCSVSRNLLIKWAAGAAYLNFAMTMYQ